MPPSELTYIRPVSKISASRATEQTSDAYLKSWRPYAALVLLAVLVYGRSLWFGYTNFDDDILILKQVDRLRHLSSLGQAFQSPFLGTYYRPIVTLSLMIDAQVGGARPWIYHVSNLLYHAIVCCLAFSLLVQLQIRRLPALVALLAFAVHPIATQAVVWIPGRNDTLLAVFLLLAVLAYMRMCETGKRSWLIGHWLAFTCALLAKETALIIPVIVLLYHAVVARKRLLSRPMILCASGWILIAAAWYLVRHPIVAARPGVANPVAVGALLTNLRVPLELFGKMILPLRMSPYPTCGVLPTIAGVMGLAGLTALLGRRHDQGDRLRIFAVSWMVITLLPPLLVRIANAQSRFDYLESRGYTVAIGFAILTAGMLDDRRLLGSPVRLRVAGLVVLVLSILSISYSGVFRDPVAHWTRAVQMSPKSSDALFNFGIALSEIPQGLPRAVDAYQRAIRLDPGVSAYHDNLGIAYGRQGLLREATGEFRTAIALDSLDALPYNNMGYAEYLLGDHDAAERLWKRALAHDSTFVEPATKLALLYRSEGRRDEARVYARRLRRQGAALDSGLVRLAEEADSTNAMRR